MTVTLMSAAVTLDQALSANLIAVNSRVATYSGGRCAICRRVIEAGERIADLARSGALVHVAICSPAAASRRAR